jgi:hypothetical protein
MGSGRNPSPIKPDLFSAQQSPDISSASASEPTPPLSADEPPAASSPSYALPKNLPSALRHLDDDQLGRLLEALLAEQERRGKKPSVSGEPMRKQRTKGITPSLAQGKLNAVRAAFKAGVKPSRIAREFGISLPDVKMVLVGDERM